MLTNSIASYPHLNFLVIINPNSGPGNDPLPSLDYIREVPKLNTYANVQTVGYIRVDWCKRPLADVCNDVQMYADWAQKHDIQGMHVKGIFVDETPNHYSKERLQYLTALGAFTKGSHGLLGDRIVIHNPGTPPDAALGPAARAKVNHKIDIGMPDVVCTCEEPWVRFEGGEVQRRLSDYRFRREVSAFVVTGVPTGKIGIAVGKLSQRAKYVFVTDLVENFYESCSEPAWQHFVSAMAALNLESSGPKAAYHGSTVTQRAHSDHWISSVEEEDGGRTRTIPRLMSRFFATGWDRMLIRRTSSRPVSP